MHFVLDYKYVTSSDFSFPPFWLASVGTQYPLGGSEGESGESNLTSSEGRHLSRRPSVSARERSAWEEICVEDGMPLVVMEGGGLHS